MGDDTRQVTRVFSEIGGTFGGTAQLSELPWV